MIGRNFTVKMRKIFLNTMQKILPENFLPLWRNRQKPEMISLSYSMMSMTRFTQGQSPSNFVRI